LFGDDFSGGVFFGIETEQCCQTYRISQLAQRRPGNLNCHKDHGERQQWINLINNGHTAWEPIRDEYGLIARQEYARDVGSGFEPHVNALGGNSVATWVSRHQYHRSAVGDRIVLDRYRTPHSKTHPRGSASPGTQNLQPSGVSGRVWQQQGGAVDCMLWCDDHALDEDISATC
jgi:hypothetical protein